MEQTDSDQRGGRGDGGKKGKELVKNMYECFYSHGHG